MKKRVSSIDVAALAGVSQSAVSRVFTQGASVSAEMRDKVQRAARELGYRPNKLARSLIEGRTRIIGLILTDLDNPFYADLLEEVSDALRARGFGLMVQLPRKVEELEAAVAEFHSYRVMGILSLSAMFSGELDTACRELGIPAVMLCTGREQVPISQVVTDNRGAGAEIAQYLLEGGHQRIAHLSGKSPRLSTYERAIGFREGLRAGGAEIFAEESGGNTYETMVAATLKLFAGAERPDAVFASTDQMALAMMETLQNDLHLRVPEDVSIIGFDDVRAASWGNHALTTWRQPVQAIVAAGIDLLLRLREDPAQPPVSIVIKGKLIERGSARRPQHRQSGAA
ncbi:LacI family DNA-binding transcriptional regulator [Pseudoruegeria sp. SK021]|uniref:LacI family DNA-binding transcriptional regulator n=1 Tax=Pseudoruegeria sp. SK021 TaxID=1933035 RepID=UPI000A24D707|nr:LacI family DNA-binding transcriptional regulator [Pseudoruegeria sp. SK021]OSP54256.1 hypothetical protein BV911_13430 [Pseudoruegeria sp. SK021]